MNPLSLLSKGRSFKDMAPRPGAYKLLASTPVPNFSAAKRRQTAPEPAQPSLFEPVKAVAVQTETVVPVMIEPVKTVEPAVSESPFAAGAKVPAKNPARHTLKPFLQFCRDATQRFLFGRKRRLTRGPTVQPELGLDNVTVMRNDLNEDDLEVVLVERKVGTGEKPLARLSKMEMTGDAWLRLTAPFRKKSNESVFSSKAEMKKTSPELSARI